jgi:SAM-dependent methyltransferase
MWETTEVLKRVHLFVFNSCFPYRRHLQRNLEHCSRLTPPAELLIDIGFGSSAYHGLFQFSRFLSLDLDRYHHPSIQVDIHSLPLSECVAQTVLVTEVLEHLSEPERALREIRRVMAPGGYLCLSVPFVYGMHGEDYRRWTKAGLTLLIENSGFELAWIGENGGPFAAIANILVALLLEIFAPTGSREGDLGNWPKYLTHFTGLLLLAPLTFVLLAMDSVYPKKNFTSGYVALLRRPVGPQAV